jgi:hypothetical protein
MGDPAYDDTTDITIPSRGENKLVVTKYASKSRGSEDREEKSSVGGRPSFFITQWQVEEETAHD